MLVLAGPVGDEVRLALSAVADAHPETNVDPARGLDLARLAAATGGREVPAASLGGFQPAAGGAVVDLDRTRLAPLALLAALLLYIADVYYRRRPRARTR